MTTKKIKLEELRGKAIEAALGLAVERGWDQISLRDIAQSAGLTLSDLHEIFEDKADILASFGRLIDHKVLEGAESIDPEASPRDRLFDILMDRYEALNDHREGIVAVLDSFKYDPKQAVISMPYLCKSMTWMLEAAGIETGGIKGAIKVAGLTGLYIKVLRTWKEDASPDLAKTMAALDKALGRAEKAAETLGF